MSPVRHLTAFAALLVCLALPAVAGAQEEVGGPDASFTAEPLSGHAPLEVAFTNTSTASLTATWHWDFGGEATSDLKDPPSHTFASPGTYAVTLTVTDLLMTDSHTETITVEPPNQAPTTSFTATPASGKAPLTVQFDDTSADLDGTVVKREWDFGDVADPADPADQAAGEDPSYTYRSPGTYTARLTVTDDDDATATHSVEVTVAEPNIAPTTSVTAAPASGKAPLTVQFDDTSDDADDPDGTFSRHWDFGDKDDPDTSDQSSEADPSYTYQSPGTYTARLVVTDDDGATAEDSVEITVGNPNVVPTASFEATPESGTAPLTVDFLDTSTDDDQSLLSRKWDFDSTEPSVDSQAANPQHTYEQPGTYTVTLTVEDADGVEATVTKDITVRAAPSAGFAASPAAGTAPLAVDFTNTSTGDGVLAWAWDFGDGTTSSEESPTHTFAQPGTYDVSLTVTNQDGVSDTVTTPIDVNARPSESFSASSLSGPAPFEPTFTSTASDSDGTIASRSWNFGDGTSGSGATVSHRYTAPGTYTVRHTVTDDDGATATTTETVAVTIPPESVPDTPAGPTLQKLLTDLLLETPGPCSVRMLTASSLVVCGGDKRRRLTLRTWAVNAGASPVAATMSGVERVPRVKRAKRRSASSAKPRRVRYRAKRGTVPAYGSQKFRMKPPKKLRRKVRRALKLKGRVRRKAVFTLQVGGATATMPHKVKLRAKKRSR